MDKTIVLNINMFSLNQPITILDSNGEIELVKYLTMEEIGSRIPYYAYSYEAYNIKILAQEEYGKKIKNDIESWELNNFNQRKLKVEVKNVL